MMVTVSVLSLSYLLPSLVLPSIITSADALKGLTSCMNHQDCLGVNRECSHVKQGLLGECVCKEGFVQDGQDTIACAKKAADSLSYHTITKSCNFDEDCKRGEVCMSWKYDPALEFARKLRSRISPDNNEEKHQFCIDAWVIYKNHMESLEEPRTGGGLRSRQFDAEEYFFGGRRPPRVQQQYIGFAEDMMLILFLVCILATLVTVHRAACYRSIQDARRNTPLRHILPLAEDRPPPYVTSSRDSTDGLSELINSANVPKSQAETPPPTYEEALYRQSVRLPPPEDVEAGPAGAAGGSDPPPPPPPPPPSQPPTICDLEVHTDLTEQDNVTEALMEEVRPSDGGNDVVLQIDNQDSNQDGEIDEVSGSNAEQALVGIMKNEDDQAKTEQDVIEDKNETVTNMIKYGDNCDTNLIV